MSIYRVLLDGVDIYDPTKKELTLINPVLTVEMGSAGNFEFTMPPSHIFYNNITPYGSNIDVFEDGRIVWSGRPLNPVKDFWNQLKYHCEGCLAYLNDTIQTPREITGTTADYIRSFIAIHNSQMERDDRKFVIRNIDHDYLNTNRTIQTNLESTFDAIRKFTVGVEGGYLLTYKHMDTGLISLDWYDTAPYSCNQKVQFAINMVNITRTTDFDEFITGVYAVGGQDPDTKEDIYLPDILWASSTLRQKYGNIVRRVVFKDCTTVSALREAAQDYLDKHTTPDYIIEAEAADLHFLEEYHERFEVGMMVHCLSEPHLINGVYPLSRIVCYLDSGRKVITLGTLKRQTLTALQEKADNRMDDYGIPEEPERESSDKNNNTPPLPDPFNNNDDSWTQNSPGEPWYHIDDDNPPPAEYPYITGGDGNDYEIGVNPTGGAGGSPVVTLTKVFSYIKFTQVYEGTYNIGDSLNLSNYAVSGFYGDGTSEVIPNVNCLFTPSNGYVFTGNGVGETVLIATHQRNGRAYMCTTPLNVAKGIPTAIHIAILPIKLEYRVGQTIDFTGIAVELLDEDGNIYKDKRYPDGFIPFNELIFPVTTAPEPSGEGQATSDLDLGVWPNPFPIGSSGETQQKKNGWHHSFSGCLMTGLRLGSYVHIVFASSTYGEKIDVEAILGSDKRTFSYECNNSYTYNGKTVYLHRIQQQVLFDEEGYASGPFVTDKSYSGNYNANNVAWTMIYGDISGEGKATIPVQWENIYAQGTTLSDSFEIIVSKAGPSSHSSTSHNDSSQDPTPVGWNENP